MMNPLCRQLTAEQKKAARKKIWLVPLGFLSFLSLWWLWQLAHSSASDLSDGYLMAFYHFPMMNTMLLPMMTAVIGSRLCDMEIKGDTLKLLYTMQKKTCFFDCKYLMGLKYLLVFVLGQGALILISGRMKGFGTPFKQSMFLEYLAITFFVSAVLLAIQQTLSLLSDHQLMPLVVGLAGCFLGLFSMFFPERIALLIIWYYYGAFQTVGMDWDRATRISTFYEIDFPAQRFFLFLVFGMIVYIICRTVTTRKEM